ncbi:prepilin-type N-terminal cleavage/methylation domain-containing protein [Bacillus sonorensis]|nr:prepilin-type N-terminal cleavage/methylation domain-containing protein [Bacillus sonorensis]
MARYQKGFTLLESLTVLLISSIMMICLFAGLPSAYEKGLSSILLHSLKQICFLPSSQLLFKTRR